MNWVCDYPLADAEWKKTLSGFIRDLAENCINAGGSLIGHIKGIAMLAGSPCLQLSLVSLKQPVSIEGSLPGKTRELGVTLNVLVFGLSAENLTDALSASREQALRDWSGNIEIEILPAATEYPLAVHGESS